MAGKKELLKVKCKTGLFQYYKNILILGALIMIDPFIHATAQEFQTTLSFSQDTLPASNGNIASLTLKIQNYSVSLQNAFVKISADTILELFSKNRISSLPAAGKSIFVPVNIRVPEKTASGHIYPVTATLLAENGDTLEQAVCTLQVMPTRKVALSIPVPSVMLGEEDREITIPVQLTNRGNTSQTISVIMQASLVQNNEPWNVIRKILLPPFADTIVHLSKKISRSFYTKNLQQIHVTGIYSNGDPLGRVAVNVLALTSSRNYQKLFKNENEQANGQITLTGQYLFSPYETRHLTAKGNVLFRKDGMNYHVDMTHWQNNKTNPLLIRNTWLSFEHLPARQTAKRWSVTIGNLSRNYEQNISGRGISVFIADSTGTNRVEAGVAQGNYNLFSSFDHEGSWQPATTLWFSFQHAKKSICWNSTLLHIKTPYEARVSQVWSNEFSYQINKADKLTLTANMGNSKATSCADSNRAGMAGGLAYSGKLGSFLLNSANFISTAYYPGLRQGAFNTQQRLSRRFGKSGSFWTILNAYHYAPKQLPGRETAYTRRYGSTRAAAGISFQKKSLSLSIQPEWSREKRNSFTLYAMDMPSVLQSWDFNTTVSCSGFPSRQQFSVSSSIGILEHPSGTGVAPFHFRTRLSWRLQPFSVMATWQSGYFYLGEMTAGTSGMPGKAYHHLFVAPQWTSRFWHNRGTINMGLSWTKGSTVGSNLMFNLGIRLHLNSRTEVFSDFTRYEYHAGDQVVNDLQTGVSSVLPPVKLFGRNYTLEVFLYKDLNRNGRYDPDDPVARQQSLTIEDVRFQQPFSTIGKARTSSSSTVVSHAQQNTDKLVFALGQSKRSALHSLNQNVPFVTDARGLICYRELPAGNYRITVVPDNGWYAEKREVTLDRSMRVKIPLQQAGVLKGGITLTDNGTNGLIREQMNQCGLQVTAVSADGKAYTILTDEKGNFIFYLPAGSYTVSLLLASSEYLCLNNGQVAQVDPGQPVRLDFKVAFKQKKIEIKRFTDVSLKANQ
jgi:hypothetical protein